MPAFSRNAGRENGATWWQMLPKGQAGDSDGQRHWKGRQRELRTWFCRTSEGLGRHPANRGSDMQSFTLCGHGGIQFILHTSMSCCSLKSCPTEQGWQAETLWDIFSQDQLFIHYF